MASKGGDELVKYITEKVIVFMEEPRSSRRSDVPKQPWTQKWFGMLPLSLSIWRSNWSRKDKE